jgi:hypothetical protein
MIIYCENLASWQNKSEVLSETNTREHSEGIQQHNDLSPAKQTHVYSPERKPPIALTRQVQVQVHRTGASWLRQAAVAHREGRTGPSGHGHFVHTKKTR